MSIPSHLYRRNGIFYFRWAIPTGLRALLQFRGGWEVRLSLRCFDRRVAIPAAFQLWQRALLLTDVVMAHGKPIGYTEFTSRLIPEQMSIADQSASTTTLPTATGQPEPLAEILGTYDVPTLQRAIAALQNRGASLFVSISNRDVTFFTRTEVDQNEFEEEPYGVERNYQAANAKLLPETIIKIIGASGNTFSFNEFLAPQAAASKDKPFWYKPAVATEAIECNITGLRAYRNEALAVKSVIAISQPATGQPSVDQSIERIPLTEAMKRWVSAHADQGIDSSWRPHTKDENESIVREFIEIVGDIAVCDVSSSNIDDYRTVIVALPPRAKTTPEFRGLTAREASTKNKRANGKVLNIRTIEKRAERLHSFMLWCVKGNYATKLPFANLTSEFTKAAKRAKSRAESWLPFDDSDLPTIFESEVAVKIFERQTKASRFWVPILALYTAGRLAEMSELRAAQVKSRNGVDYIELCEWDEKALRLKTDAATREIPLHQSLIDLGFLSYAKSMTQAHDPFAPLFPDLPSGHKEANKPMGYFFNKTLLTKLGIKTKQKVFHSLRHTAIGKLKRANVSAVKVSVFNGHIAEGNEQWMAQEGYGGRLVANDLTDLLPILDYPIDWSKLKNLINQKGFAG